MTPYHSEQLLDNPIQEDVYQELIQQEGEGGLSTVQQEKAIQHQIEAWQIEATSVDRSVQILPGVKTMMDSIPKGRYAVATSGAKTYGKVSVSSSSSLVLTGCLQRMVA